MIRLEIREQDDQGEVIAVHEGVKVEPGLFRDEQASMMSGFVASDTAGEVIGYLLMGLHPFSGEKPAIAIDEEDGVTLNGLAAYFNENRSPYGYFHYTRSEDDGSFPPGPDADKQHQLWTLTFHEETPTS